MSWWNKLVGKTAAPTRSETPFEGMAVFSERDKDGPLFDDQPLRKQWAEDVLRAEGVPINASLPVIESEAEVTLRSAREVADRLAALCIVAAHGADLDIELTARLLTELGGATLLTPAERAFLLDGRPSNHARLQFAWRYEAAWVLFWALQLTEGPLGPPRAVCNVDVLADTISRTANLTQHDLRPAEEILNEADLIYRYHWAIRQAGIDGQEAPAGLHPDVVMERHHALNWLIRYGDNADWDEVPTDT